MQPNVITIPHGLLKHTAIDWGIDWRGQGSGDSTAGVQQVFYNAFPRWVGSPSVILHGQNVMTWRAVVQALKGRRNVLRVRMCDMAFGRAKVGLSQSQLSQGIPFDNGLMFSNGQGFYADPFCTAVSAVAKGATEIDVDIASTGPTPVAPKQGQIMSVDDLPFDVASVMPLGGTQYRLTTNMPIRTAVEAGDRIMMVGTGLFFLADDRTGQPSYGANRVATPTIELQEWLR